MVNVQEAQDLSKFISRALAEKGVKQSEVLELMAQFNNFKDWNTFKAVGNKNYALSDGWVKETYAHVDNGGFFFNYDEKQQMLSVSNGFFGYSENKMYIPMTKKELGKMIHAVKGFMSYNHESENRYLAEGVNWEISGNDLTFYQQECIMNCSFYKPSGESEILIALEKLVAQL